jgi:hypothetical protein
MKLPASWPQRRPAPPDPRLDQILALLQTLDKKVNSIMVTLADIATAETAESTAISGVVAEISSLELQLAAAQTAANPDPAAIQAIVDQIHANTAALTAALPAASTPPPPAAA